MRERHEMYLGQNQGDVVNGLYVHKSIPMPSTALTSTVSKHSPLRRSTDL